MITGGCQCGAVRYRIAVTETVVYACHCRECQRQSGSAFGLSMPVRREQVELTGMLGSFERVADSGARSTCSFCPTCGTRIHHASSVRPDRITIKAGTLDETSQLVPVAHLWVRWRQFWVQLEPTTAAFETQPADLASWRDSLCQLPAWKA